MVCEIIPQKTTSKSVMEQKYLTFIDSIKIQKKEATEDENEPKKKKQKQKKDPDAPKRPRSAYVLWSSEERKKKQVEWKDLSAQDTMTKLGQLW